MKALYIYTAGRYTTKGPRYGQHFRITRSFEDVREVIWQTDGRKDYVRVGEFCRVDAFWSENEREQLRRRKRVQRDRKVAMATLTEGQAARIKDEALIWAKKRSIELQREEADRFRLVGG